MAAKGNEKALEFLRQARNQSNSPAPSPQGPNQLKREEPIVENLKKQPVRSKLN